MFEKLRVSLGASWTHAWTSRDSPLFEFARIGASSPQASRFRVRCLLVKGGTERPLRSAQEQNPRTRNPFLQAMMAPGTVPCQTELAAAI